MTEGRFLCQACKKWTLHTTEISKSGKMECVLCYGKAQFWKGMAEHMRKKTEKSQ